jgi:hypothetical protein
MVRRMVEMCSLWVKTAYFCSGIRTRENSRGRSEKSETSMPAM